MSSIPKEIRNRIIVALDVPTLEGISKYVRELSDFVGAFKVGLEILTAEGSERVVRTIHDLGGRVFYDGKFNDIPNTVGGAAKAVAKLGVWMFNVHASSGAEAVSAAVTHKGDSKVIAVTVLTSMDEAISRNIFGASPITKVMEFARLAAGSGADGVVCSPQELTALRSDPASQSLMTIVPGIRPTWAARGDQARVMTPSEAIKLGASALVIGRPILQPPASIGSPYEAAARIIAEIEEALGGEQPASLI